MENGAFPRLLPVILMMAFPALPAAAPLSMARAGGPRIQTVTVYIVGSDMCGRAEGFAKQGFPCHPPPGEHTLFFADQRAAGKAAL